MSGFLTKSELAELLGVNEAQIRSWRRDGVLPADWTIEHYHATHETAYQPVALALGELIVELRKVFGGNSPVPNTVAIALRPRLAQQFRHVLNGAGQVGALQASLCEGLVLTIPTTFLDRAKDKLQGRSLH